jgi:hypothetical protein
MVPKHQFCGSQNIQGADGQTFLEQTQESCGVAQLDAKGM